MSRTDWNTKYYYANRIKLLKKLKKKRKSFSKKKWTLIKRQVRIANRKRLYGLSEEQYQKKLLRQGNKCAICRKTVQNPGVDHDRSCCNREGSCGKCIRGLLCLECNTFLGFAKDDIKILNNAIKYLKRYSNGGRQQT